MRSIRRSLLGYLLLLLAVALGGVGALVDRYAAAAFRQREASESDRIEQAFKVRQNEARVQFDADLTSDARSLAVEVHRHGKTLLGQNEFRPRPNGKGPPPDPPAVLKAGEEEARQYRLRSALLEFAPVPGVLPALAPVAAAEPTLRGIGPDGRRIPPHPYPNWVEFEGPRALARIQESLRKEFTDEQTPGELCQFTLVAGFPGSGARRALVVRGSRLPKELPLAHRFLEPTPDPEPVMDDVVVPGLGPCRHVALSALPNGRPIGFFVWLPPPPEPAAQPGFTRYSINRGPDMVVRVVVHVARPYSELGARLAADQQSRGEQLDRVREETRAELSLLRARLILIGVGTFAALVLGGWLIVARGLSPLRTLSEAVSRVSEKDFRLPVVPAELSRELAPIHARLTQTLTLLQRAFAREKQAVADISHELRTPIASLLATIDVALRKPRTPDQYRTTLEECRLISKQLGQLVERIMTLASLDAGNDHTVTGRIDAADLAEGCAAVIRPLAAVHNVTLSVRHDGEIMLDTDSGKLREVLMNLLHNAVEYNRPGGTIELAARRDGDSAVFEVRDTGIGMTPEVRERIFERFYRADASRSATGVHAGLGLAIVKEYVARLRGTIAVESEPGVGTTFRVALPLAPAAPAELATPAAPPPSADRAKARGTVRAS
jgi:signal transduction histidine kinase